jgi:hypothetical protein
VDRRMCSVDRHPSEEETMVVVVSMREPCLQIGRHLSIYAAAI